MKYLSVCSGIEAASVAFKPLGWEALAFSEIEAFPRAVLQHHYPEVPLHGDFTELRHMPFIVDADLLCGGTPCQSFSIAGLRKSMSDDRGNLTLQFILLADAIDNLRSTAGREPAYVLWENVPGVFSTSDNAFGAFLGGLCGRDEPIPEPADGWTGAGVVDGPTRVAAWRVLDAQHFGLAQRRKRVFVLAKGGAGRWAAADALLPIIESLRWHSAPSRGERQGFTGTLKSSSSSDSRSNPADHAAAGYMQPVNTPGLPVQGMQGGERWDMVADVRVVRGGTDMIPVGTLPVETVLAKCITTRENSLDWESTNIIAFTQNQRDEVREQSVAEALSAEPGTHQTTYVAFDGAQITSKTNRSDPKPGDPVHTLRQGEPPLLVRMREGKEGGGKGPLVSEDQSLTLATANDQVLAIHPHVIGRALDAGPQGKEYIEDGSAYTMDGRGVPQSISSTTQVRRLTPTECARLQGFPDDYLDITFRGKPATDGNKYKALGNSWAVPVVRYIGERLKAVMKQD